MQLPLVVVDHPLPYKCRKLVVHKKPAKIGGFFYGPSVKTLFYIVILALVLSKILSADAATKP